MTTASSPEAAFPATEAAPPQQQQRIKLTFKIKEAPEESLSPPSSLKAKTKTKKRQREEEPSSLPIKEKDE
jgi:hypothetical protein